MKTNKDVHCAYRRQKCTPGSVISGKVLCGYSREFSGERREWVIVNGHFK